MIRVRKEAQPDVLASNAEAWSAEFAQALASGKRRSEIPARYRHPTIKAAVVRESHGKCIYCEAKIGHTQFGDVEHLVPVSARPDLVVAWANLGFVCQRCNNAKRDYWDAMFPVIDPFGESPEEFLLFLGPWVTHRAGNQRGQLTVKVLQLNRIELLERRKERLDRLAPLLDQIVDMPAGPAQDALTDYLVNEEAAASAEYTAAVSAYLRQVMQDWAATDPAVTARPPAQRAATRVLVDGTGPDRP